MSKTFEKYGALWPAGTDDLGVELACIKRGGKWKNKAGKDCGLGLFDHYMNARKLLWPDRYRHRWTESIYKTIIDNNVTVLMGCASSQKTSHASEYVLISYWARPENTIGLVTTVNIEKLEMAVFGEIKKLFKEGKDRYDWLAGNLIDYKHCISTDEVGEGEVRDLRRGIVGRPNYVGKQEVGLGVYAGIKQEHVIFLADEIQFCSPAFLGVLPNMFSNPDVKVICSGNPNHNPDTQLGIAAEPEGGWSSMPEPEKTATWRTRFYDGVCLNLVGTDSPNFDGPPDQPDKYHRLIGRRFASQIEKTYGPNSPEFYTQVKGVMRIDMAHSRVITRELCRAHKALEKAAWKNAVRTRVLGVDPAYGGGDRAISICLEFGVSADDRQIVRVVGYRTIPINLKQSESAEDQIAAGVARDVGDYGVPIENCFYDSFGKGTVGFAFARKFGSKSPIPVDPGGRPSKRPVRQDLFVYDESRREKRLKRCDEHYSKFITELWFSVRYAIEAEQLRELPEEIMHEGCMREYDTVAGDKIEVEPKADMRERLGKSPDLFDALAIAMEGARQRGFSIDRLGGDRDSEQGADDTLFEDEAEAYRDTIQSKMLAHV